VSEPDASTALVQALDRLGRGEASAADLGSLVYEDLRRLAGSLLRRERIGHTLQATALVHEAWLRLADACESAGTEGSAARQQYLCLAATAMRRILVEHARARLRQKRGGDLVRQPMLDDPAAEGDDAAEMLDLDEALQALAERRPRAARIAELRIYGGFSVAEAAEAAGVGLTVAKTEWALAQALLGRWLRARPAEPGS